MGTTAGFFHEFRLKMNILNKYIARRLLISLLLTTLTFLLITLVIDLTENIDTFIDYEAKIDLIALYYAYRIPYWLILILPISCLLGSIFALTSLARHNEVTAMKTLGFSINRILIPIFFCGASISGFAFVFTDYVVPSATLNHNKINKQIRSQQSDDGSQRHVLIQGSLGEIIYARNYDAKIERAEEVSIEMFTNSKLSTRIIAENLFWNKHDWIAVEGYRYTFRENDQTTTSFDTLAIKLSKLSPEDFSRKIKLPEEMTYSELKTYISRGNVRGEDVSRHRVDLYLKGALPFASFIIIVLGSTIGANARSTSISNSFGSGILICFVFYGCLKTCQALGWNGLISPLLSAWSTNILFVCLTLCIIWRINKTG